MNKFKIGDIVRIKNQVRNRRCDTGMRKTAQIEKFYADVDGGVRLNKAVDGFVSWNVSDLEHVKAILTEFGE